MAFFSASEVKRNGPQWAKDNADMLVLVANPVKSDSWATFQSKIIAQAAITGSDINMADQPDGSLKVTVNGKSDIDPTGPVANTDDLCVALASSTQQIVCLVNDATDIDIPDNEGDRVNIPALVINFPEYTAA